jgi:hypothetical protein
VDPRDYLTQAEGFDDVVVGTDFQPDDAIDLLAARGHDDDRDIRALAEFAADGEAVGVGKPQVEQNDVARRGGQRGSPRRNTRNVESFLAKAGSKRFGDRIFVLDE